jgi:hypothetical protein
MPILETIAFLGMLGFFAAAAVILVAFLTGYMFANWFRERRNQIQKRRRKAISMKADKSIKRALRNGDVTHVTGIFDEDRAELVDAQAWAADEVDDEIRRNHKGGRVAVYS